MNNKRRVLSFLMALIMLLGVMSVLPITVSAEGFDYRTDLAQYSNAYFNYSSIELNRYIGAKPVADGVIGENEYNVTRNARGTRSYSVTVNPTDPVVNQYFAHDDDYVYLAFAVPSIKKDTQVSLCLWPQQVFDNAGASYFNALKFTLAENSNLYVWGIKSVHQEIAAVSYSPFGALNTYMSSDAGKLVTKTTDGGTTYSAVAEFKFSKIDLARSVGIDVSEFKNFRYTFQYNGPDDDSDDRGVWWEFVDNGSVETAVIASSPEMAAGIANVNHWVKLGVSVNINYEDIQSADCGSIRLPYGEDEKVGLRFQTTVSKAYIAELRAAGYDVEVGTLIAPTDYIGKDRKLGEELTIEDANVALDVKADLAKAYKRGFATITFTGAIADIKESNYIRDFTAVGYIKMTKTGEEPKYVYSDPVVRNVKEIADAAFASGIYAEGTIDYNYLEPIASFDSTAITDPWGDDFFAAPAS